MWERGKRREGEEMRGERESNSWRWLLDKARLEFW